MKQFLLILLVFTSTKKNTSYKNTLFRYGTKSDPDKSSISSTASILDKIAEVCDSQSNYSDALDFYLQSLDIKKLHFGDFHPSVAMTLANIAILHQSTNEELEAASYYKQALDIFDKFLPPNHPHIRQLLNQYSQLLLKLNRTDEAQPLLDRLTSLKQSKQK